MTKISMGARVVFFQSGTGIPTALGVKGANFFDIKATN
jgi:hypothetical protein